MRKLVAVFVSSVAVSLMSGCGVLQHGYPQQPVPRPGAVLDFSTLYGQNCAACHGADGKSGPALDLANPEYLAMIDDATLRKWVASGMPGTQMPAFAQSAGGMLTDAQVEAIVAGMRQRWSRSNAFEGAQPPPYAQDHAGDVQRGLQTYQARCAMCHKQSREEITSPLYLALVSDQALRTFILAGSPGIGQPDWRHDAADAKPAPALSAQEVDDIVAYLGSLRNAASGTAAAAAQPAKAPRGRESH